MRLTLGLGTGIFALVVSAAVSQAQVTVYDNFNPTQYYDKFALGAYETGDEITLAGSARTITSFDFQYFLTGSASAEVAIRFYDDDGPAAYPGWDKPGTVLFDSGFFGVSAAPDNKVIRLTEFVNGAQVPLLGDLPEEFVWTATFRNVASGAVAGLGIFTLPSTGRNYDDYWSRVGDNWGLREAADGTPISFGARINAVPEPSTISLAVLGLLGFAGLKLRRNRR